MASPGDNFSQPAVDSSAVAGSDYVDSSTQGTSTDPSASASDRVGRKRKLTSPVWNEFTKELREGRWQAQCMYPTLQRMAHDILPIPVTTVASESAFSTSGRVLSAHRSSLAPNMAEALMCMQAWSRADMLGDCNSTLFAEFQSVLEDEEEPMDESVSILTEE